MEKELCRETCVNGVVCLMKEDLMFGQPTVITEGLTNNVDKHIYVNKQFTIKLHETFLLDFHNL